MWTTEIGNAGEQAAAEYLTRAGFNIVDRNWKTTRCEIDIVATKGSAVYFVEVKYRSKNTSGSGLEYVTHKKVQQMQFAVEIWLSQHNWQGEINLAAIEVSGQAYEVSNFIESSV